MQMCKRLESEKRRKSCSSLSLLVSFQPVRAILFLVHTMNSRSYDVDVAVRLLPHTLGRCARKMRAHIYARTRSSLSSREKVWREILLPIWRRNNSRGSSHCRYYALFITLPRGTIMFPPIGKIPKKKLCI